MYATRYGFREGGFNKYKECYGKKKHKTNEHDTMLELRLFFKVGV